MITFIDFKTDVAVEKNSETSGRIFIILDLKTDKTVTTTAPKISMFCDQITGGRRKKSIIIIGSSLSCKKTFKIVPSFQKQTP